MKLNVSEAFWQLFLVMIQLGAVLAVVLLDFEKLWPFHKKDPERESNWKYISENKKLAEVQKFTDHYVDMNKIVLWLKILVPVFRRSSLHFRLTIGLKSIWNMTS